MIPQTIAHLPTTIQKHPVALSNWLSVAIHIASTQENMVAYDFRQLHCGLGANAPGHAATIQSVMHKHSAPSANARPT